MKFKNEKNVYEGQEARILSLTDKDGDTLDIRLFLEGKPQVVITINGDEDGGAEFGMTRDKAVKFYTALMNELHPSCI